MGRMGRRLGAVSGWGVIALVTSGVACSSATPTSDCTRLTQVACQKYFQCAATAASQQYGNEANCETQLSATFNCATLSCPSGTTYNPAPTEQCINDINNETCAQATALPGSCNGLSGTICK
jgi:hypothetical protein